MLYAHVSCQSWYYHLTAIVPAGCCCATDVCGPQLAQQRQPNSEGSGHVQYGHHAASEAHRPRQMDQCFGEDCKGFCTDHTGPWPPHLCYDCVFCWLLLSKESCFCRLSSSAATATFAKLLLQLPAGLPLFLISVCCLCISIKHG